jgi:hypothetical protein
MAEVGRQNKYSDKKYLEFLKPKRLKLLSPIIMPKIMLKCRPNGRRGVGRPLKRLFDKDEIEDNFQKAANKLNQIITRHDLSISTQKKLLAFK